MLKHGARKIIFILFPLLVLIFCGFSQGNRMVAVVNNEAITLRDLRNYQEMVIAARGEIAVIENGSEPESKKEALERLVEDRLILQQAHEEEIEIPRHWLQSRIKQISSMYPSREAFLDSLEKQGLTLRQVKERLAEQFLSREIINRKVREEIFILPGQIKEYYQKNQDNFKTSPKVFFLTARKEDTGELKKIGNLIDREGIASAKQNYGNAFSTHSFYFEQLQPQLEDVLLNLDDASYLITQIGQENYLIYREKVEPGRPLSLSEAQEKVYQQLWEKKFHEKFDQWIQSLRKEAVIKKYL